MSTLELTHMSPLFQGQGLLCLHQLRVRLQRQAPEAGWCVQEATLWKRGEPQLILDRHQLEVCYGPTEVARIERLASASERQSGHE